MANAGNITIDARMKDEGFQAGINRMISGIDKSKRKSKDLTTEFKRMTPILNDLKNLAVGFGAAVTAGLTASLATSPHCKAFMLSLKGPWLRLSKFVGETFKPVLDKVAAAAKGLVDFLTTNPDAIAFF